MEIVANTFMALKNILASHIMFAYKVKHEN